MKSGRRHIYLLLILGLFLPLMSFPQSSSAGQEVTALGKAEIEAVLPELQRGGYVFYIRHAATDHSKKDSVYVDLGDCDTQRPLSAKGREQAADIGEALKKLAIPVGEVLSSPFCRCKETALLAFGRVQEDDSLYFAMTLGREGKQKKAAYLRNLITSHPVGGLNKVIVSHTSNLMESVGIWPKPEGVTYIFRPDGKSHYASIGYVLPETWKEILR